MLLVRDGEIYIDAIFLGANVAERKQVIFIGKILAVCNYRNNSVKTLIGLSTWKTLMQAPFKVPSMKVSIRTMRSVLFLNNRL
jgi:hypothetical protein